MGEEDEIFNKWVKEGQAAISSRKTSKIIDFHYRMNCQLDAKTRKKVIDFLYKERVAQNQR